MGADHYGYSQRHEFHDKLAEFHLPLRVQMYFGFIPDEQSERGKIAALQEALQHAE